MRNSGMVSGCAAKALGLVGWVVLAAAGIACNLRTEPECAGGACSSVAARACRSCGAGLTAKGAEPSIDSGTPDAGAADRTVIVWSDASARGSRANADPSAAARDADVEPREIAMRDADATLAADAGHASDAGSNEGAAMHATATLTEAGNQPVIVLPDDDVDAGAPVRSAFADAAAPPAEAGAAADAASSSDAGSLPVPRPARLVINEIDYDQVGVDDAEFVEIYNSGAVAAPLADVALVLVNGATASEYARVALGPLGELAPGAFLVVAGTGVVVASGAAVLRFELASNNIQNGPADAVGLLDTRHGTLIDALSYEGPVTSASVAGVSGGLSFVEGSPLPDTKESADDTSAGSLIRLPDGADTDDAAADFRFTKTPTPGAANQP